MNKPNKVAVVITILLVLAGGITWFFGWRILNPYRWQVFKAPIRLEKGLSSTGHFTVDVPAKYYLGIGYYKRMTWINPSLPTPADDFSAEFTISSGGSVVAQGSTTNDRHATAASLFYTIRYLEPFDAEPGRTYDFSFRITDALPALTSTKPTLTITIDPLVSEGVAIRGTLVTNLGVGLILVGLLIIVLQLSGLTREKKVLFGALLVGGFLIISVMLSGGAFLYSGSVLMGLLLILVWQRNRNRAAAD
jgi:hypothetical protein